MVDLVHNDRPSQELISESFKPFLHMHERVGKPDDSRLPERFLLTDPSAPAHARKRKESRPPELIFLQECDHPLCRLFRIRHDVLYVSAERCLHSDLVLFIHFYDIRDYAEQALLPVSVCHHLSDAVPIAVIALRDVFQRLQAGRLSVIGSLPDLQLFLLIGKLLPEPFNLIFVLRNPPAAFCDPAPDALQLSLIFPEAVILLLRLG